MDSRAKQLIQDAQASFAKQRPVQLLWSEIAGQFYPERDSFIVNRAAGDEFADHLYTAFPSMVRRDLADQLDGMLRRDKWFKVRIAGAEEDDLRGREWLEMATNVQFSMMRARAAHFSKAAKQGDHDYTTFGQTCISLDWDTRQNSLLYQTWPIENCAWENDYTGEVSHTYVQWKPTVGDLVAKFGLDKVHSKVAEAYSDTKNNRKNQEVQCYLCAVPGEHTNDSKFNDLSWVIYAVDIDNFHIMQEDGQNHRKFIIPRWHTLPGTPYAISPATMVALPEARLIQDMARVLLQAGERAVDPPLVATQNAIRGDVNTYPGAITWVGHEYDEAKGEALRPMTVDKSGLPAGLELQDQRNELLTQCFYLNKLTMPYIEGMTATEVRHRIQEYVRQVLPLFQPMEEEYNGQLCDETFEVLMQAGRFGPAQEIPQELMGEDIGFEFSSPVRDALEIENVENFRETMELLAQALEIDQGAAAEVNIPLALRDAIRGTGAKIEWLHSEDDAEENRKVQIKQLTDMAAQSEPVAA